MIDPTTSVGPSVNAWMLILAATLLASGCQNGMQPTARTFSVSGAVTYNGQPVGMGTITFYPVAGGQPASGQLGTDGKFTLTTFSPNDGAVLGEHKVVVQAFQASANVGVGNPEEDSLIPVRFGDIASTPLTASVVDGNNEFTFQLDD